MAQLNKKKQPLHLTTPNTQQYCLKILVCSHHFIVGQIQYRGQLQHLFTFALTGTNTGIHQQCCCGTVVSFEQAADG